MRVVTISRKVGQSIRVGDVRITVAKIRSANLVQLNIECPDEMKPDREEASEQGKAA